MKPQVLFRKIHHWGSLLIMMQMGLLIGAGLLLQLKKEIRWIHPATIRGEAQGAAPTQSIEKLFGVVKFIAGNNWEVQIDTSTGHVLQVSYRRSDIIERLHDGSFFADWVKLYIFFPSGVILFTLWGTGIYLFVLPHWKRARRTAKRKKLTGLPQK